MGDKLIYEKRGDVEALYNSNGELRARYVYDSWGNMLSITNASGEEVSSNGIGRINPIRYRGYYYDNETGVSDKSWAEIGVNAVVDSAISYGLGKLPSVDGITKGRNSMSAVYKSGLTKLRNGTAARMSLKVIGKGIASSFVGGLAMDGYYGIKQHAYDHFKRFGTLGGE